MIIVRVRNDNNNHAVGASKKAAISQIHSPARNLSPLHCFVIGYYYKLHFYIPGGGCSRTKIGQNSQQWPRTKTNQTRGLLAQVMLRV